MQLTTDAADTALPRLRVGWVVAFGLALAVLTTVAGCTVSREAAFTDVQEMVDDRVGQRVEWAGDDTVDAAVADTTRDLLAGELTADVAVRIALLNNRNLQATFEELGIARAELVQAGLLRNPVITFERRFSGKAMEFDVVQDLIELITLPLRRRIAGATFEAAKLRMATAVLDLAAEVGTTFYALQGAEQLAAMRRQVVESSAVSEDLARRIHSAGNMTDLDLRMEQRLASQARLDLAAVEEEAIQQRERLNTLMGLWGEDTVWTSAPRLPDLPESQPRLQGLESQAVHQRLDLAAARQDIMTATETLGLTSALRWVPGITGNVHFEREPDGGSTIGPGLDLILPIFDWGQAAVPRERAFLRQKQQRYIALAVEIRSQVRAAYRRMHAARARTEFYRRTVLPLQVQVIEQAQLQYNAMILGPLQLFQLKQAEIDTGRQYIEAHRDYWVARAELEHALGGRIATDDSSAAPARAEEAREQSANDSRPHQHQEEP